MIAMGYGQRYILAFPSINCWIWEAISNKEMMNLSFDVLSKNAVVSLA